MRAIWAGVLFSFVFFTNYRLIIIPFLLIGWELMFSWANREKPQGRKLLYTILTFLLIIFSVGSIDHGATWGTLDPDSYTLTVTFNVRGKSASQAFTVY